MGLLDGNTGGGMLGLLSPDDRLMAALSALSQAGAAMAQPGQSRGQALASGFGAMGPGMMQGMQHALMNNVMMGNVQNTLDQRKAQQAYIDSLPPDQQLMARANPAEFSKTQIDRAIPKMGELPAGVMRGPDGRLSLMPGATDALGGIEGAKAGARTMAERGAQNAVPLRTETPEYKGQVAGAEANARNASELGYADPLARARMRAELDMKPQIAAATANAENPALISRAVGIAQGTGQTMNNAMNNAGKLRDDFNALPTVKAYRETVPIYQSMQDAQNRDSKAADLNLVYGLAKIMDPNSVVREGEMVMVNNTAALPDWLVGSINGLNGGQRLMPETRKAVMAEASSRVSSYKDAHDFYAEQFGQMADRAGINRKDLLITTPEPKQPAAAAPAPELPTAGFKEGTIATGPRGEQKIFRSGKWTDLK